MNETDNTWTNSIIVTDAGNSNGVLLYKVKDELLNNLRTFKYYYTNFTCQGHEHKIIIQQV